MSDFKIVKLVDPIVVQTNGVNASITGNTAGTAAVISSGTMYLAGGNNITLSQSQNTISINGGAGAGAFAAGVSNIGNTSGNTKTVSNQVVLAGGNNITLSQSTNAGGATVTVSAPNQSVQTQNLVSVQGSTGDISFGNANGITFGGNASTVTASYTVPSTAGLISAINLSAGTTSQNLSKVTFNDSNGISFGLNGSVVTATVKTDYQSSNANYLTSQSNQALSGSNGSFNFQTATFGNSNGLSFYTTNGSMVGSYTVPSQTVQTQNRFNATLSGNTAGVMAEISSGTLTLAGGNNITLSQNGNAVTISGGAAGAADGVNALVVNGGASTASTTLALSNANNVTFGHNAGTITASASYPTQTNQTIGIYGSSQTTGQSSSSTYDARSITFRGAGNISVGNSGGEVIISATGGGAADGVNILAAGTQTANTTGSVKFADSNGISFGMSNSSQITASYTVPSTAGLISAINLSAGTTSNNLTKVTFSDSNGVSFGLNGSVVTATVKTDYQSSNANYLTSQSNQAFSAQGGSSAFQTLSFTNSNGFSFSNTNGSIWGSYTVPTVTNSSLTMQAGASTLSSVSRVAFGDSNGVSFGASTSNNGSITITASHNGLTSQSNQALSGSNGSFAFQTATFGNLNGMSFYTSNGSMVGSYTVPSVPAQTNQTIGIYGSSQTTGQSSSSTYDARSITLRGAGNISVGNSGGEVIISATGGAGVTPVVSNSAGSFSFTTLNFSNANNVTWGTSAGSIVTASVAAPGAAAENNWFALTGANTAGNTTASGSTIGLSGINLTLSGTNGSAINISAPATSSLSATGQVSMSTNGSTISIGVPAPITHSRYNEFKESPLVAGEIGQASLHIQPWLMPNLQYDRVVLHKAFSNATNSSFSFTVSDWVGIYTKNGSTLSLLQSASISTNFSGSGTAGSYLSYGGGIKAMTAGMTNTLTEGMYWVGVIQRTTTGGGAGHTLNQALNSNINSTYRGLMGAATNATNQMSLGFGVYTVSTSAMPGSIGFTQINGNSSVFLRPPSVYFVSGTI